MPDNWNTLPLEDCMAAIIDYRGKSPNKTLFGVPLVTAKIIKSGRIARPEEFIADDDYDEWMRRGIPLKGDVVMTTEAPLGEVAQLDGSKIALAQRVITLRGKPALLDNTFLKFLLQSRPVQDELASRATGTTVLGIRQSELRKVRLTLPPIAEQEAIAHILGTLDDKIELNRRMNETLVAMVHALFKSWFIDFDPVRAKADGREPERMDEDTARLFPESFEESDFGEMPRGWKASRVADVASLNAWTLGSKDRLDHIRYIEISEVMNGEVNSITEYVRGSEPSRARRRLRHGDTVLSTVRPDRGAFFLCVDPDDSLIASTGFAVVTPTKVPWAFLYTYLTRTEVLQELGHLADGGAYPAVRPEIVGNLDIVVPADSRLLEVFHRFTEPLYLKANSNRSESRSLAATRDALLPKLLSGELRIKDAERLAGA